MKILRIIAIVLMILFTINGIRLFPIQIQYVPEYLGIFGYIAVFIGTFILPFGLFFLVKYLNKKIAENENK